MLKRLLCIVVFSLTFTCAAQANTLEHGIALVNARQSNKAADYLWPLAKSGDPKAQYYWVLAKYYSSEKTFDDYKVMSQMLHASAEHGNPYAMMKLAGKRDCKWLKTCGQRDKWFNKALFRWIDLAKSGDAAAQYQLSLRRTKDRKEWMEKALDMGSADAGLELSEELKYAPKTGKELYPDKKYPEDVQKKMIGYLTKASELNNAYAMVELSKIYFATPTKKNIDLGFKWLKKSVDLNYPDAAQLLSKAYIITKYNNVDQKDFYYYIYIAIKWGRTSKDWLDYDDTKNFKLYQKVTSANGEKLEYLSADIRKNLREKADQWLKGRLPNYFDGPFPGNFIH